MGFFCCFVWLLLLHVLVGWAVCSSIPPHPSSSGPPGMCEFSAAASPSKTRMILDISHSYRPDLPEFDLPHGIGMVVERLTSISNGSLANISFMKMGVHTGTHVDGPNHFYQDHHDAGFHVDTLDLQVLNGPALLVDAPRETNITAEAMEFLRIPYGVERVLFRTLNTDRGLMWKREFDSSYVGFTTEGARWLKENTLIKLVGIDYLSVAAYDDLGPAHLVLLKDKDIILVEGLNLDEIDPGLYDLHCLPLKLPTSDGSPIRCILEK